MEYQTIFQQLWQDYRAVNPSVDRIHQLLELQGNQVLNDHIAFRTCNLSGIDIEVLAKPFLAVGYKAKGNYFFEEKRLKATHYEHESDEKAPKVFISELITEDFSPLVRETALWIAKQVRKQQLEAIDLLFSKRCWNPINYASYEALRKESEYAAWFYVYGFRANHFTVAVNHLQSISSLEEMNEFLINNGFSLNVSGGEIKGTREELLKQSSTLADKLRIDFEDGSYEIPCCYYEFAERFKDTNGKIFNGFIAKSADKIFESTNKK